MMYFCSSIGIFSSFKEGSSNVLIGNIGFLYTCDSYLSIFAFFRVYAPLSAIDYFVLISVPTTYRQGLSKAKIYVFNLFSKSSKKEVTLGNFMAFDLK